jgi:hypothetical protein
MIDEFDDPTYRVTLTRARQRDDTAGSHSTYNLSQRVCAVYETAPAPVRTKLLECLLRPVGPLALVAIASGAFGHLLYRLRRDAEPIALHQVARITSDHVLELAEIGQGR